MKYINLLVFCFLFFGCSKTAALYWCGDHACRSVAEKNTYFKKTMTVEIKKSDQFDKIIKSDLEIIKEQTNLEDKKRNVRRKTFVKRNKSSKKRVIKNEKKLAKQARMNKLKKIKNEKKNSSKISFCKEKKKDLRLKNNMERKIHRRNMLL
ncbi:MAG: hypothetical protein CMI68_05305 [Candidatus Pelagibacter sp.]|nr:hypothetical protein [Candidatus Pelagibacter sp.]